MLARFINPSWSAWCSPTLLGQVLLSVFTWAEPRCMHSKVDL